MKIFSCASVWILAMTVGFGQDSGMGAGAATPPAATASGTGLTGTIKLDGQAPKPKKIKEIKDDSYCSTRHTDTVFAEDVVVGDGNTLANVFVYVKKGAPKADVPAEAAKIDQEGCVYKPHVLGVMVGQTLTITSSDDTTHNINVDAKNNPKFNENMGSKGLKLDKTFSKPELGIAVTCQVHPWMKAVLHVVDNPFFAVTGKDGKFSLNLPAGEYEIEAIHEKFGKQTATVKVADGGATQDFTFAAK